MAAQQINVVLRLLNGRRFQSSMYASARSIRAAKMEMQDAALAGSGLGQAGRQGAAGLHMMSAAAQVAGYAVGAAAVSWVAAGVSFNTTMESNQLAFSQFVGEGQKAKFTMDLFRMAAETPFAFTDITTAARKLLAVGFSAQETTRWLEVMGDALAYIPGAGQDEIYRLTKALGDIRAKGRLMQQEMNQLTNLGLNTQAIRDELNLTEKQAKNLGRAGIDAETALQAIDRAFTNEYGGGAEKYMQTLAGQWQRLKDNLSMSAGQSTTGVFGWLKTGLTDVNDFLESGGGKTAKTIKTIIEGVAAAIGGAVLFIVDRGKELMAALEPAAPFLQNVLWPIVKGFAVGLITTLVAAWKIFIWALGIVARALGWVGDKLEFMKPVFFALGFILSFFVGWILKAVTWLSKFGGVFGWLGRTLTWLSTPLRILYDGVAKLFGWLGKGITAFKSLRAQGYSATEILKLGFMYVLEYVKSMPGKMMGMLGKLPGLFLGLGKKIGKALIAGIAALFGAAGGLAGDIGRKIGDWLNAETPFGDEVNVGPVHFRIPALASGGDILRGGYALVGEEGPEVVRLPTGASVAPNKAASVKRPGRTSAASRGVMFEPREGDQVIQLVLDGRVVTEVVGNHVGRKRARA